MPHGRRQPECVSGSTGEKLAAESRRGRLAAVPRTVEPVEPEETSNILGEEEEDLEGLGEDEEVEGSEDEDI